jgi:methylene-fatty-acyl-phospholipid synthase
MSVWLLCSAAVLLSLERITYVLIWRDPVTFRRWAGRPIFSSMSGPVELLALLFGLFKVVQIGVFIGWLLAFGDGTLWPYSRDPWVIAVGILLIAAGQALNLSVFRRLGKVGVFYGNKFGHAVSWCRRFPFTWFDHPQYVGTVLAIWGFFLVMRFPAPDWIVLPVLESVYYTIGARLERDPETDPRSATENVARVE